LQSSAAVKKPAPSSPSNSSLPSLLARITGRPLQEIEPDASPTELGIDSLMTIELQDELKCQFGVSLPIETLVKVGSVRDLERLIGESSESAAPRSEQGPAQPLAQSEPRSPTEIREAVRGDYEQIAALTYRNGLEIKPREEWEHLWVNNPVYKKVPNWPIGWVVRNGTEIVGFLGNIPVSYHFKGREIIGASLHAFTLDSSHRGYGLLLLNRLLECGAAVEYLVGSTANANSSKVLERTGIAHVPTGDWENSVFWITNYAGFLNSALTRRGWPKLLAYPGSTALDLRDKFLKRSWPRQSRELHPCSAFDERFDVFWEELKRAYPHRFLATRSREVLDWHFKYAHAQNRAWILTVEEGSRILAYGILYRHDNREINLKRIRLIDFQTINGDNEILVSMLAWGLRKCREEGIHMLEAFGFRPDKQRVIERWAQYRRRLPGWLYFYKAPNQSLHQELQDPNVWDPSQFDGDASL
jgi:acyl carrier protein